jgi:hypothetical protein
MFQITPPLGPARGHLQHLLVNSYQHFGEDYCIHLQGQSITREDNAHKGMKTELVMVHFVPFPVISETLLVSTFHNA